MPARVAIASLSLRSFKCYNFQMKFRFHIGFTVNYGDGPISYTVTMIENTMAEAKYMTRKYARALHGDYCVIDDAKVDENEKERYRLWTVVENIEDEIKFGSRKPWW